MAEFYGQLQGSRGRGTRCGTKASGITASVQSFEASLITNLRYDEKGEMIVTLSTATGSHFTGTEIFRGTIQSLISYLSDRRCSMIDQWIHRQGRFGPEAIRTVKKDGYEIELFVQHADDEYRSTHRYNGNEYAYRWEMVTMETFYPGSDATNLARGYTNTLDEGIQAADEAFENIEKYRKEWRNKK